MKRQVPVHFLHPPASAAPRVHGLGDVVEFLAKPIARQLHLDCLDERGKLRPDSGCARRKARLNQMTQSLRELINL